LEYRIYPYELQRVRDEKKFLLPSFSFVSGFRRDSRFAGLQETHMATSQNPVQQWVMRSFVTLTNVFERNPSGKNNSGVFNVGLGFETLYGVLAPAVPAPALWFLRTHVSTSTQV
jgi:hypothetical protein